MAIIDVAGHEVTFGREPTPPDLRDWLMSEKLRQTRRPVSLPTAKAWTRGPKRLNQGNVGACVAFAGANWDQSEPVMGTVGNEQALADYWEIKRLDLDGLPPGTEGTYDRALMKLYEMQGKVESYHWADTIDAFWEWLLTMGGIMIGVNWYDQMSYPDPTGLIVPGGLLRAGHEVFIWAGETAAGGVRQCWLDNSWGDWWGIDGTARIALDHIARLVFLEAGTACAAVQAGTPPSPAPTDDLEERIRRLELAVAGHIR